jgi:hypothetical protein
MSSFIYPRSGLLLIVIEFFHNVHYYDLANSDSESISMRCISPPQYDRHVRQLRRAAPGIPALYPGTRGEQTLCSGLARLFHLTGEKSYSPLEKNMTGVVQRLLSLFYSPHDTEITNGVTIPGKLTTHGLPKRQNGTWCIRQH